MARIRDDLTTGRRVYIETAYGEPVVEKLKDLGATWDREGGTKCWWIGAKKRSQVEALLAEPPPPPGTPAAKEDPDRVRLVGKCKYKGRTYYARFIGETKKGYSAKLTDLKGDIEFWAKCARPGEQGHDGSGDVAVVVKTYAPREYRGRTEYTTLGSIQNFIQREASNRAAGGATCAACGTSGDLVEDLEDGLLKHHRCCDIPPS